MGGAVNRSKKPVRIRLPHDETDERKRYSLTDPDGENADAYGRVYSARYSKTEPDPDDLSRVLSMAGDYLHLTTYELGQEHCVRQLRELWRARRAAAVEEEESG